MAKLPTSRKVALRIKEGSALERILEASPHRTVSGALHEIAAAYEAAKLAPAK